MVGLGIGAGSPIDYSVKPFTFSYVSGFNLKDKLKNYIKKGFDIVFNTQKAY